MTNAQTTQYIVQAYRTDNGAHVAHLDRAHASQNAAQRDALASNCKAYTPFFFTVRTVNA